MKTRLILETGCNHQGVFANALDMINQAVELGAWAIKFQKRDIEQIPDLVKITPRNISNSFGKTYYEHRKALELDIEELSELKKYAEAQNIIFICSAFDVNSLYKLREIGCHDIKIPSQYLKNSYFYDFMTLNPNLYYYVSTGMHNRFEVLNSRMLERASIIMHCISKYPCQLDEMKIQMINVLAENYPKKKIGYSSHEIDGLGIKYAVLAGAKYIERHFTLDKSWKGSDHSTVSSDYAEVKRINQDIGWAESVLGDSSRELSEDEKKVRKTYIGY